MIVLDKALGEREASGNPVRFAMVGAGFMAQGVANQVFNSTRGMQLVAIANRHPDKARAVFEYAGVEDAVAVDSVAALGEAMSRGVPAYTDDPFILCDTEGIDCILEVTGSIEYGAGVVLRAIEHGKHVVVMNAELDGTVGPILKAKADAGRGGVHRRATATSPGVEGNLYRFVKGLGITPLLMRQHQGPAGSVPQSHDAKRLRREVGPEPVDGHQLRRRHEVQLRAGHGRQRDRHDGPHAAACRAGTSTAGTSTSSPRAGMTSMNCARAADRRLRRRRTARPGRVLLGTHDDPKQRHYLNLYKLGEGPLYCFYTPYHLCHFETPTSIARAVIYGDPTTAPDGAPKVEVVTIAKVDLKAGQELDRYGGYLHYGEAEKATIAAEEGLLPQGVADGCVLLRDIPKDQAVTYADVKLPAGRLCDQLRAEQAERFGLVPSIALSA